MRKFIVLMMFAIVLMFSSCKVAERSIRNVTSSVVGLDRIVSVYDGNGDKLAEYTGKIDIETNDYGNKVKFDVDGKRIMIYNAIVIVEEK